MSAMEIITAVKARGITRAKGSDSWMGEPGCIELELSKALVFAVATLQGISEDPGFLGAQAKVALTRIENGER